MDMLFDMLKNKEKIIKFLLQSIENNQKTVENIEKLHSASEEFKVEKLIDTVRNQSIQIRNMSMILLVYSQGSNFTVDVAQAMNKMGRGEEALKEMMRQKMS